jgi:dCMP deaminase
MRPTRDQMGIESAQLQSKKGKCNRLKVGCVITREGRIISSGYNGSIIHNQTCEQLGCDLLKRCEHSAHAEENAIAFAAQWSIGLLSTILYITTAPCYKCARLIKQSGIAEVVYLEDYVDIGGYPDYAGINLLQTTGVVVRQYNPNKYIHE